MIPTERYDAREIQCEWDEDGCFLIADGEGGTYERLRVRIADPEQLYDRVKAAIGPWLRERDEARSSIPVEALDAYDGYDVSDPKHPDYHSVHADLWDNREGK